MCLSPIQVGAKQTIAVFLFVQSVVVRGMTNAAKVLASRAGALCTRGHSRIFSLYPSTHRLASNRFLGGFVPRRSDQPALYTTQALSAPPREEVLTSDPANNVSDLIYEKIGVNLHLQSGHPLCTIKKAIQDYFDQVSRWI